MAPLHRVACPWDGHAAYDGSWSLEDEHGLSFPNGSFAHVTGDGLEVILFSDADDAWVDLGDRVLYLAWDASGRCTAEVRRESGGVYGHVVEDVTGFDEAWVWGCGGLSAEIGADGEFFIMLPERACAVYVVVRHDGLVAFGRPVTVALTSAYVDEHVVLSAPSFDDLRPWTGWQRVGLELQVLMARSLLALDPEDPWYREYVAHLEALEVQVDTARAASAAKADRETQTAEPPR